MTYLWLGLFFVCGAIALFLAWYSGRLYGRSEELPRVYRVGMAEGVARLARRLDPELRDSVLWGIALEIMGWQDAPTQIVPVEQVRIRGTWLQ